MKPGMMDYWRDYFRSANSDIFGIIDHAIMVAASDCPKEFRMRRDQIAERLFSSRLSQCSGCHRVELAVPPSEEEGAISGDQEGEEEGGDEEIDVCGDFEEGGGSKGSKVNSSSRRNETDDGEANLNNDQLGSNYSYDEAEALTDEIEEQSQVFDEVLRIKSVILNHRDETDSTLFDSLRRLQLMALSVDTIKATEIGKVVNNLRKHGSAEIRHLARTLIELWKDLVDEWFNASKTIVSRNESTPDSGNPSVLDEEYGLPSPPMDEAFFATQATGIELSQFFDGMDDDGNPRNAVEMNRNRGNGRKPSNEARSIPKLKQQPMHNEVNALTRNSQQMRPSKPLNNNAGPRRPLNQNLEQKVNNSSMLQRRTDHQIAGQRNPSSGGLQQQNKLKCSDEVAVQMKLEATKRKLQESYQQANNAKRQRTIQVMELHDLPKQGGTSNRNPNMTKHGNGNRHWANGRR